MLRYRLDKLEEHVDVYWKQRAHVNWLEKGDKNTKFFHSWCSERRRRNRIGKLKKEDGGWVEDEVKKQDFIANHFVQLFRARAMGGYSLAFTSCAPQCY